MKVFFLLTSLLFLTNANYFHKDRILEIDEKGNITGLPKKFSPAKFDIEKKKLRIKNKAVIFPECIGDYFEKLKKPQLKLTASWYHPKQTMPYYISINVQGEKSKNTHKFLINLETLELIRLSKTTTAEGSYSSEEIVLDKDCICEYNQGIRKVK